jgi:dienelactone hydrolase
MKNITLYFVAIVILLQGLKLSAQPVPHHFTGIATSPDKTISLSLGGSASNIFALTGTQSNQFMRTFDLYPVEASTDLANWTRLALLRRTNNDPNPLVFFDGDAAGLGRRFYRTVTNHLLTFFPKPTGPYAVGTTDRIMIDPTRTNLYRYTPKTNAFMVTFWYPAEPTPAGALPDRMWDKRVAADLSFFAAMGIDRKWAPVFAAAVAHRAVGVPLAAAPAKYPAVLLSIGLLGTRKAGSQEAEELASHGYVVVGVDHSDCWASEFPDGRYLAGNHSGDIPGRLKDMTFLLDELERLNSSDPLFAGRLDLERIGGSGSSFGGTVVETCRTDSRMKCVAIWDATNIQALSNAGLQKPLLIFMGENNFFYSEDLWLFNKATNNAVFLQIRGASHGSGWDASWLVDLPKGAPLARAMTACSLWFFEKYLKDKDSPFPTNPEIYNIKRK